jgi:uncharacterized protein (TIGR00255 family)
MIKSMTAFAKAEISENQLTVGVEIRTLNSRYLDYAIRVPHGYSVFEEKIKECVGRKLSRGRIELRLFVTDTSDDSVAYEVNLPKARAYYEALSTLTSELGMAEGIPLNLVAGVQGVISASETEMDADRAWALIERCLDQALDDLDAMRTTEGNYLKQDFKTRLDFVENAIETIRSDASELLPQYQKRLQDRVASLCQGIVEIDHTRIAQEAALLADRSDISEELVRASSHVIQFRNIMDSDEPAGRKLNFLLQEFNREFNTMGSKAGHAGVAHLIVDVKSELERLREQVQNVE